MEEWKGWVYKAQTTHARKSTRTYSYFDRRRLLLDDDDTKINSFVSCFGVDSDCSNILVSHKSSTVTTRSCVLMLLRLNGEDEEKKIRTKKKKKLSRWGYRISGRRHKCAGILLVYIHAYHGLSCRHFEEEPGESKPVEWESQHSLWWRWLLMLLHFFIRYQEESCNKLQNKDGHMYHIAESKTLTHIGWWLFKEERKVDN